MKTAAKLLLALLVSTPAAADLSVGWIAREPKIEYVWRSTNPTRDGWPQEGQQVRWVGHVWNLTGSRQSGIVYRWTIDGATVAEGETTLEQGDNRLELPWTWTFDRHEIALEIDTTGRIREDEERNNRLLIHSDAAAVGFWVERGFWDGIRPKIAEANIRAVTFADWMQLRIRQFNSMAELARYDETPNGSRERWRIDEIHIVDDGALPLVPPGEDVKDWGALETSWPTLYPDSRDRTVDMMWGFPLRSLPFFANPPYPAWTLLYDSLVHELGHARTLIDVYAWRVDSRDQMLISPIPPHDGNGNWHITTEWGLMNTQWGFLDRYSAVMLDQMAGRRAVAGNFNEPWDIGWFLNLLPARNRLILKGPDGRTFPGRTVRIYQSSSRVDPDWLSAPYKLLFDDTPDLELTTDAEGAMEVGANPFSDAELSILVDRTNVMALVELLDTNGPRWGYLESFRFNLAYVRGDTELAEHTLTLGAPQCVPAELGTIFPSPWFESLHVGRSVEFGWRGRAGRRYELWWSIDGGPADHMTLDGPQASPVSVRVTLPKPGRVAWWYVDLSANADPSCPPSRSATYFFDLVEPDGRRSRPARR
jgi:hypothetical protein